MPYKDIEKRRAKRREWYALNKTSEKRHVYRRRRELLKWFEDYKKNLKCSKCGENHPAAIDFHHENQNSKEFAINYLVHNGYSLEVIEQELKKCIVLCANCHRKLHYKHKNSNI